MADLSVAHRVALAHVIEGVPDRTLRQLAQAVSGMPGDKARSLEAMLQEAGQDRKRRAVAFAAIAPLFQNRTDGVEALTFPAAVLPRLWKTASAREPALLDLLDEEDEHGAARVQSVAARLCASAASVARDEPMLVWPPSLAPDVRDQGLSELARCCDLAGLAARALPSLKAWVGRPDGDQIAELRLVLRDAAVIASDGAQRLLNMLFAHLADAALILRVVTQSSNAASREAFVSESELAVFIDRLLAALCVRSARISAFRLGEAIAPLKADLAWSASVLEELDVTLHLHAESPWGRQAREMRGLIGKRLAELLGAVSKAVNQTLPMGRVQTAGRMTRNAPRLEAAIDPATIDRASQALDILRTVRSVAGPFGCEAQRQALIQSVTEDLTRYGDLTVDEINAGDAPDETLAQDRVEMVAAFLDQIEAVQEARTVRRRAAVAGGPSLANPSPRAA